MAVSDGKEIRYFNLHNGGGFVVKLKVLWEILIIKEGNEGLERGEYLLDENLTLGFNKTLDLNGRGIPEGATVTLQAIVKWGADNTAKQSHTYKSSSNKTSYYTITGAVRSNTLGEIEVK